MKWETRATIDAIFQVLGILALCAAMIAGVHYFGHRSKASNPVPPVVEKTLSIDTRFYANSSVADYYMVMAGDQRCYVREEDWLNTYVGQPYTCAWSPIGEVAYGLRTR